MSKRKAEETKLSATPKKVKGKTEEPKKSFTLQQDLVDLADEAAKSGGVISFDEAKALWTSALDGPGVTANEFGTLEHILNNYKFTKKGRAYLDPLAVQQSSGSSLYKKIGGVKYDRSCMDLAVHLAKDGTISLGDAKQLWEDVEDGQGVTETEKRTIDWVVSNQKLTDGAKKFFEEKIATWNKTQKTTGKAAAKEASQTSGYTTIDGAKYEKKLLELADKSVKGKGNGRIGAASARLLWTSACDGPGVTQIERATLVYILKKYKCTAAASKFLHSMVDEVQSGSSYYRQIKGQKYVRALLDKAETLLKDGQLDAGDAKALWKLSMNGGKVTESERKTVQFFLDNHALTKGAKGFFEKKLKQESEGEQQVEKPKTAPKKKEGKKEQKTEGKEGKEEKKEKEKKESSESTEDILSEDDDWRVVKVSSLTTLRELCASERLPYSHGCGFYQLGTTKKKEKVQDYKELIALKDGKFHHGSANVRKLLGLPTSTATLSNADIPEGYTLFCQSTSPNRKVHPGSTALIRMAGTNKSAKSAKSANAKTGPSHAAVGEMKRAGAGGRAHFSGTLMSDHFESGWLSKAFVEDKYSEYVGVGAYPKNIDAFPKAIGATFDGIAIDAGTRVTIYEKPGFQGKVLYSRIGPAVVINSKWKTIIKDRVAHCLGKWEEPLNSIFPSSCRELSSTDMHTWNTGSLIVSEGEILPEAIRKNQEYAAIPEEEADAE